MDESKQKNAIYKNGSYSKILGFSRNESNIKKVKTNYVSSIRSHMNTVKSTFCNSSPNNKFNIISERNKKKPDSFKINERKYNSPYITHAIKDFSTKNYSPEFTKKSSYIILNREKKINKREFETNVKMIFYYLISTIYLSLYFLSTKILFCIPMPYIPPVGTSLFIISFNNAILSVIFIIIDQIDYLKYLYFEKIGNNFLKMIFNFSVVLFTIISLENIKLLSFIILINMKPIIISFLNIRESDKPYSSMDILCYFLCGLICVTEFLTENKISIIFTFILIIIDTFDSFAKLNTNTLHPYLTILGCSIIGISISPLIMAIRGDLLIICFSQYLLFLIISLTHFFYIYFLSKYIQYSFGTKFQIFSIIVIYILFIIYSFLLLREKNTWSSYIFFMFSLFINNYAILRNDSTNI